MKRSRTSRCVFPCSQLPADRGQARLLGLYPQRQKGLWMQRLKILGGRLGSAQWRRLGEIIREYTPNSPLHLTTRQDVELHDLTAEAVPEVQVKLADVGLSGVGACGDTFRNITICPCSGTAGGSVDLAPLAWQVRRMLEGLRCVFDLPRKFKISFSCSWAGWGLPWINDLGFVAHRRDGNWGFRVIAAGSLGRRPMTGIPILDWVEPAHVPALAVGTVKFFNSYGDRKNRGRARLRHVRERLGEEAFVRLLREHFAAERARRGPADVELPEAARGFSARAALNFPNGDVSTDAAEALAELAGREDRRVRIALDHQVIVFGRDPSVHAELCRMSALGSAAQEQTSVIACPGRRWCARALVDTNGVADRLRGSLAGKLDAGATVRISGCPSGCAHSGVAQIGLIGGAATKDGQRLEVFDIYAGGGGGRDNRLAALVGRAVPAEEVPSVLAGLRKP